MATALRRIQKSPWRPDDVNQFIDLLTGVLQGQAVSITTASDVSAFLLTLKALHASGNVLKILAPDNSIGLQYDATGLTVNTPVTLTGGLAYTGGPVYNVVAEGMDNTGVTPIDGPWSDLMTAIPSTGARIYIPAGTYECTGALSVTKPCIIYGDGMLSSLISSRSATADLFSVSIPTQKVVRFADLGIARTAAGIPATDGAGIKMVCSTAGSALVSPFVERCFFANQFVGLELWDATNARIIGNSFGEQRDAAIQFDCTISPQGFGDNLMIGNALSNGFIGNTRGVRIKRGAGFLVANNKFIGFQTQVSLETQAAALNQSDLWVLGNSMEGQPTTLSCVGMGGASSFEDIIIANNQMVIAAGGAVALDSASIADVHVIGNTIDVDGGGGAFAIGGSAGDDMYAAENKIQVVAGAVAFVNTGITNFRRGLNRVSGAGSLQSGTFAHIQPKIVGQNVAMAATNAALGALFTGPATAAQNWADPFMVTPHTVIFEGIEAGAIKGVLASVSATQFTAIPVGAANATVYNYRVTAMGDG